MNAEFGLHDQQDRMLQEWLLLLLRFAVTHEPSDRSVALAMAEELDSLGMRWRPAAPRFFLRAANEVCEAIIAIDDEQRAAVLRKHLARIDNPRLKSAFRSAVGLQLPPEQPLQAEHGKRRTTWDLWKGLAKK